MKVADRLGSARNTYEQAKADFEAHIPSGEISSKHELGAIAAGEKYLSLLDSDYKKNNPIRGFGRSTTQFIQDDPKLLAMATIIGIAKGKGGGVPKGLGSSRSNIRKYMANVHNVPRAQLVKDLEAAGFKKVFDGKGMQHFKRGKWTVRLDPPQGKTAYPHMHINRGGNKNAFDASLRPTSHKLPEAHIPIQAP